MGKGISKGRSRRKRASAAVRFLRREGRKLCAAALCTSLVFGSIANTAVAADKNTDKDVEFKLSRGSLYKALQEAVLEGNTVEEEFAFVGEEADVYEELLEADGDLYELTSAVKNSEKDLKLRVFARLDQEIELDSAYEVDGSEEIVFLLTNSSEKNRNAVIYVDEKYTEPIEVVSGGTVGVTGKNTGAGPAAEMNGAAASGAGTGTAAGGSSSGGGSASGGGSSAGGGSASGSGNSAGGGSVSGGSSAGGGNALSGGSGTGSGDTDITIGREDSDEQGSAVEKDSDVSIVDKEDGGSADIVIDVDTDRDDTDQKETGTAGNETAAGGSHESGTGTGSGSESGTGTGSGSNAGNGSGSGSESGSEAGSGSGNGTGAEAGSGSVNETGKESGSGSGSGMGTDTGSAGAGSDRADGGAGAGGNTSSDSSTGTNGAGTGSAGSGSTGTGSTSSGSASSGSTGTGSTGSGSASTGSASSGSAGTGSSSTGGTDAGSAGAGSASTGSASSGSAGSGSSGTGSTGTGSTGSGSTGAGSAGSGNARSGGRDTGRSEASVSIRPAYRVMAAGVASPSTATRSDADENLLEGTLYHAVQLENDGAAAFVVDAEELGLDDPALMKLATPSNADYAFTAELDQVIVHVYSGKNVLPEEAELRVTELTEDDEETADKFQEAKDALDEAGKKYDGLKVYDVSFFDETGEEIEPDGDVLVSMEWKPGALPENADLNTLTVQHLAETKDGIVVETVAATDDEADGNVAVSDTSHVVAEFGISSFSSITMLYDLEPFSVTGVTIRDDIFETGSLTAVVTGTGEAASAQYQWYVSEDGSTWTEIEDTATVDSREESFYVARDGAQKYFKVRVTGTDGSYAVSDGFKVDYYDALQNGSFEEPGVYDVSGRLFYFPSSSGDGGSFFLHVPNGTEGLEWKTTAYGPNFNSSSNDYFIEIADGSKKSYYGYQNNSQVVFNIAGAADGDQFAELNCQVPGALYQDILTQPGSTLYWGLEHAGRQGEDTMAVIISDTKSLKADWNPSANNYNERPDDVQAVLTDSPGSWNYHAGSYTVPEGQYVTRFYFVAVYAAGGERDGNLLDNISFSKDVPNPPSAKGNLMITKTAENVEEGIVPAESFVFEVKDPDGAVTEIKLPTAEGAWSYVMAGLEPGSYVVTEKTDQMAELDGYSYVKTRCSLDGATPEDKEEITAEVRAKNSTTADFINTYQKQLSLQVMKKVTGNMGDTSADYSFTASVVRDGKDITAEADKTFTLKDNNSNPNSLHVIRGLNPGDVVTVTETGREDGYSTTIVVSKGTGNSSSEQAIYSTGTNGIQDDTEIVFTNDKTVAAPTGIFTSRHPYLLMLAAAALCGAGWLLIGYGRKRREQR